MLQSSMKFLFNGYWLLFNGYCSCCTRIRSIAGCRSRIRVGVGCDAPEVRLCASFVPKRALPSRGGKRCRKNTKSKFLRLFCSLQKSYAKTFEASPAAFWLSLEATNSLAPCFVVVVAVYPLDFQRLCVAFALVLARLILLAWEYVRIIIEYCGLKSVCEHPFYYCRTAWCAAGMEQ